MRNGLGWLSMNNIKNIHSSYATINYYYSVTYHFLRTALVDEQQLRVLWFAYYFSLTNASEKRRASVRNGLDHQ
jgi:hypothetical protein